MNLLGALGLDQVSADPNEIPDGKYDGDIFRSEYVLAKDKSKFSHVVTYRVTEGENKGAQRQQWYTIGKNPKNAQGGEPDALTDIAAYEPAMSDSSKSYYKKMWVDLGVPEAAIATASPEDLVGKQVTFGVKRNGGYTNINFVELRAAAPVQAVAITSDSGPTALLF